MTVTVWPARENLQSFSALWRFEQGHALRLVIRQVGIEQEVGWALDPTAPVCAGSVRHVANGT
jgi:hypothetical protein